MLEKDLNSTIFLTRDINTEDENIRLIICQYNENTGDKLVNAYHQFK